MDEVIQRLDKMQCDIDEIKEGIKQIVPQTQKMDEHIDFINIVYSKVKRPFHFICDKTSHFMGKSIKDRK